MSRESPAALGPQPDALPLFPTVRHSPAAVWWRAHRRANGPWWFSSEGGRFDLSAPRGTCYLATDSETAIREVSGHALIALGVIMEDFARARVLSQLAIADPEPVADTVSPLAASCGFIREVCTMTPYDVPQRWATAFDGLGLGGISYQSRFTTGTEANATALFGEAGEDATRPTGMAPTPMAAAARSCGITVAGVPRRVRIAAPPHTAG